MKYRIYCDGAASNNGYVNAIGGCAYVIVNENDEIVMEESSGPHLCATNNRMELYACYLGLEACMTGCTDVESIEVYTDSAYLHNCKDQRWYEKWLRNGWINSKKECVANRDLWEKLIPCFQNSRVTFYKVKGHSGDKWNEYVDKLAVQARQKEEN